MFLKLFEILASIALLLAAVGAFLGVFYAFGYIVAAVVRRVAKVLKGIPVEPKEKPDFLTIWAEDPTSFSIKDAAPFIQSYASTCRTALSHIVNKMPAQAGGAATTRIYTLCSDALREKVSRVVKDFDACKGPTVEKVLDREDRRRLYFCFKDFGVAAAMSEHLDRALCLLYEAWADDNPSLTTVLSKLASFERQLDNIHCGLQSALCQIANRQLGVPGAEALSAAEHLSVMSEGIREPAIREALGFLSARLAACYSKLSPSLQSRMDGQYLPMLGSALDDFIRAEAEGKDLKQRKDICLRAIAVIDEVLAVNQAERDREIQRRVEVEVDALDRLTALRGDRASTGSVFSGMDVPHG